MRGQDQLTLYSPLSEDEDRSFTKPDNEEGAAGASHSPRSRLLIEEPISGSVTTEGTTEGRLDVRATAWLSFEFCILWVSIVRS